MKTTFNAPWDSATWTLTGVFVIVLLGCTVLVVLVSRSLGQRWGPTVAAILVCFDLVLLGIAYMLAPRKYEIISGNLLISRAASSIVIPSATIAGVEFDGEGAVFKGAIRTSASGGAFGFFGKFHKAGFGAFHAYATRTKRVVIIRRTDKDPVVVTPDDPEAFIALLNRTRGGAG